MMMADHDKSCSCISCISRSSEHLSPRDFKSSKIEKLYSGKHIPAREKKLLDKLVKARNAYDDIRTEILSGSNVSVNGKADLRPKKRSSNEDDKTKKSSTQAILKLVDIVDRGGSTEDLSECCNCCICKPDGSHARDTKVHRHGFKYHSRHRYAHHGRGHALSKASTERYRTTGGTRSRRPVHFVAKRIRSVPCTCTYELIKRKSQAMIKRMKMRPENAAGSYAQFEDETFEKHGAYEAKALIKKSLQKMRESEIRIKRSLAAGARKSARKAKQSTRLLESKLQAGAKNSLDKLKSTKKILKNKADDVRKSMQSNLKAGAKNSIEKFKTTHKKMKKTVAGIRKSFQTVPRPKFSSKEKVSKNVGEKTFPLKKDSVTKFREKIRLLEEMDEWVCEHECYPKECVPEDCLKILLKNKERRAYHREDSVATNRIRQHTRKVGQSSTESNIQARDNTTSARLGTRKIEVTQLKERTGATEPKITISVSTKNEQETNKVSCECSDAETRKNSKGIKNELGAIPRNKMKRTSTSDVTIADHKLNKVTSTGTIDNKERKKQRTDKTKPQITISVSTKNKQGRTKVLCECSDAETRKRRKGIKRKSSAGHQKFKRNSMTDVTLADRKLTKVASTGAINNKERKNPYRPSKASSVSSVQQYPTQVDTKPRATVSASSVNRQTVRISSSFSFSIEFYKNKPSNLAQTVEHEAVVLQDSDQSLKEYVIKKKDKAHHARKSTHRVSETRLKKLKEDTQIGGHALKRCICNLKLKSKKHKTKIIKSVTRGTRAPKNLKDLPRHSTESVQTKRLLRHQKALRPYECEPDVCVPDECNPFECYELIKKNRRVKHHSVHTTTGSGTRSVSSFTKSTLSRSSKPVLAYSPSKTKETQQTSEIFSSRIRPVIQSLTQQRQAVRVGSSFSFNVEFYKDRPVNDTTERLITTYSKKHSGPDIKAESKIRQRNKDKDGKPRYVRHLHSQRSMSTGKSKYFATKHKLRRCFCTLKLKPGNGRVKQQSKSRIFVNSKSTVTQTPKVRQKQMELRYQERKLSSNECEPGMCIPGECNAYKCLKILNKTEGTRKKSHEKYSYTENSRTMSSTSFTPQPFAPSRANEMQSNIITYKTEVPSRKYKEKVIKEKIPKQIKTSHSSLNRQAVRIGSSFSFDVKFYKDRRSPVNNERNSYVSPTKKIRNIEGKNKNLREKGSQEEVKYDQISVPVQVKNKERHTRIESIIKRCFCTLNLNKNKNKNKVKCLCKEMITTGTETSIIKQKKYPTMVTKSTKTKQNKFHLKSHECEPYVCVSGECDPHKCLERIKRRDHLKQFGTSTDQVKMRSGSSFTQNLSASSGTGTVRARSREQKTSTKVYKKRIPHHVKIDSVSKKYLRQPVKKSIDSISNRNSRQAVIIGSSFSFDIEFYKDHQQLTERTPMEKSSNKINRKKNKEKTPKAKKLTEARVNSPTVNNLNRPSSRINSKGIKIKETHSGKVTRRKNIKVPVQEISTTHQETQAENTKRKHKTTGIKPILKKCFCTLQFKKEKIQQNYNTIPPQVYTVSRVTVSKVTVAETKVTTVGQEEKSRNTRYTSKKKIITKKAQLLLGSKSKYTLNESQLSLEFQRLRHLKKTIRQSSQPNINNSKSNIEVNYLKDLNTIYYIDNVEDAIRNTSSNTVHEGLVHQYTNNKSKDFVEDYLSNLDVRKCQVTGVNSFLSRCYCTMNVTDAKGYKLKPYECEPGVCVPYKCDPYECQKRINRRLRASKMSGTDSTSKSTSSYSNLMRSQRAKKLQSKIQLRSTKTTHAKEHIGGFKYKTDPKRPQKQMVRVGSSFSFDVQFSKDRSPVTTTYREVKGSEPKFHSERPVKTVNRRTKGTRGRRPSRHNRDSQSGMRTVDRGASGSPRLKRCFCTLKLHKKGKQQQQVIQSSSEGTMTSRQRQLERPKAVTTTIGQNTKANKARTITLDPHECEPGVCTPGNCNPYDCLELIKRRNMKYKTRGFSTASTESRSASSATNSKRRRGQRIQSDLRGRRNRGSIAAIRNIEKRGYTQSTKHLPQKRQMVRIGSTFSFNIEFYKDRTPHTDRIQAAAKALKTHQKKVKTKHMPRSSSKGSVSRSIGQHSRDSQVEIKTGDHSSGAAPMLKRCFCTLKLQKQDQHPLPTKQVRFVNEGTKTRAYRPTPTLYNRSVMTKVKLKSYECEPGVCVPGECDPYECDKLIQKRLRREFGTSTGRNRTRSALSSTSSTISRARKVQYTGGQHRTRNRPIQSRDMIVKPSREKTSLSTISDRSHRQAVKIGSSFSFNIEFFKDKGGSALTIARSPKYVRNVKQSHVKPPKVKIRAGYSQDQRSIRSTDSQIGHNMRSMGTGIKPMLKRCFCTLSFKNPKKKPDLERLMLDAGTDTHKAANKPIPQFARTAATRTKQVYHLSSYECEPGICVPLQCDPYECLRRIKRREMRTRIVGTHTPRHSSISSITPASGRAIHTQSRLPRYKHQTTGNKDSYLVEDRRFKSIENPFRQAVRISSSFSFNIELYKDKLPELAEMHNSLDEGRHKKRVRQEGTESRRVENKGVCKDETCLRNRHLQSQGTKTYSRGTGVGPMLKRCFCTLKLFNGKNQHHRIPDQSDAMTSTARHYRQYKPRDESVSIGVGTKRRTYDLKPFECEPNVCVPGECDPYDCLERINRRKMRNSGIGAENIHGYNRSTATLTQKGAKCRDTQCYRDPSSKCRSTQCYLQREKMKDSSATKPIHRQRYSPSSDHSHRQSVRIGSNFSFDIEFFRDRKNNELGHRKVIYENVPSTTSTMKAKKYANKGSHGQNRFSHQTSQMFGAGKESRASGMTLLKRCFCTLKLRKDLHGNVRNETKTVNFVSLDIKPPPLLSIAQTCNKISGLKTKRIASNTLSSYKCYPQICVLKNFDRFDTLKKLGKKTKYDHSTARMHTDHVYFCSMVKKRISTNKSAKVLLQDKKNQLDSKIVNKLNLNNNLGDKYFTISNQDETNTKLRRHPNVVKEMSKRKKSDVSIDKNKRTLSKSSCLHILQNTNTTEPYPEKELIFKKIFVGNEVKMSRLYHSKRRLTTVLPDYGQKTNGNKDKQKLTLPYEVYEENEKNCNINQKTGLTEMKTLFPYIPNKFNKNTSKTIFFQNNETFQTRSIPLDTKDVKMLSGRNYTNHEEKNNKQETGSKNKFSIKEIIKKCAQLFKRSPKTKRDSMLSNDHFSEPVRSESKMCKTKKEKRSQNEKMTKTDILKSSKSDRRPSHSKSSGHSIPKKSKSLKITKASERCRYHKKHTNYINEGTKKYSRFQSGDAEQGYIKPVIAYLTKPPFDTYKNNTNFHCSYCQILYDKDKEYLRSKEIPTFMDEKVVQHATLVSPKNVKLQNRKDKKSIISSDNCNEQFCASADVNDCPCVKRISGNPHTDNKISPPKGILINGTNNKKPKDNKKPKQEIEEMNKQPLSKRNKLVCKTKKPCVCCAGGRKKTEREKRDLTPAKRLMETLKKDKCKDTCITETEEEAGKPICIKMFEKCIPKLYDYIPHHDDKCVYDPMFSMKMDSNSMAILNRDEIYEKVLKLKSDKKAEYGSLKAEELKLLHGKSCSCCICQSMKQREPHEQHHGVSVASLGAKVSQFGRKFGIGKEPCICGSAPCAAEVKKVAEKAAEKKRRKQKKPCVCGTKICEKESLKIDIQNHLVSKKGGKKLKKIMKKKAKSKMLVRQKQKQEEKAHKEWLLRQQNYKKEDVLRRKKQQSDEKKMNKQVKKYKNTNSWLLAAESILDIGQLLYKSTTGILRFTGRAIMDPKRTTRYFKDAKRDPSRILTNMKNAWSDSGVHSTARRVGMRIGAMPCWMRFIACLEQCAVTHYLVHMCDKNPKTRLARKKKLVRRREPMDFECSLYMASLRKKPWLSVYYKFKWFYPHCVSMLHIVKSVVDVLLFILAVVVWSPCLCCLELCRALMCCTLCTG